MAECQPSNPKSAHRFNQTALCNFESARNHANSRYEKERIGVKPSFRMSYLTMAYAKMSSCDPGHLMGHSEDSQDQFEPIADAHPLENAM